MTAGGLDEPVVTLLGAWDHWLLSWADRTLTIPADQTDIWLVAERPSAFADGHAFGTWRTERGPGSLTIIVEPFGRLPGSVGHERAGGGRPGALLRDGRQAADRALDD